MVSGGAAPGNLIGALASNGRGVAGGPGADVLAKGNEGRVLAETGLEVALEKELRLGVTP